MEGKEETHSFGVTKREEFPAVTTAETFNLFSGSAVTPVSVTPVSAAAGNENNSQLSESALSLVTVTPASGTGPSTEGKKKRGRPRKYGPDGKPTLALSPMPISASIPLAGEFSGWKNGRGRSVDSFKKKHKLEFQSPGTQLAYSVGTNFTPHVITVNTGEDVSMKIISFSQQGSRAICILAANGSISNVTLRQPNSSGGTLTYEGRFEILSLSGSFTPTDSGGLAKSRSGGMSVSLAGPDGRVLGGGLAGFLVAGGPVQVVIASFMSNQQQVEPKPKKQRVAEYAPTPSPPTTVYPIISSERTTEPVTTHSTVPKPIPTCSFLGENSVHGGPTPSTPPPSVYPNISSERTTEAVTTYSTVPKPNSTSFLGENSVHGGSKIMGTENNVSPFPRSESKDHLSSSKLEVSW